MRMQASSGSPIAVGIISAGTGDPPSRKMSMVAEIERVLGIRKATSGQLATFSKNAESNRPAPIGTISRLRGSRVMRSASVCTTP
jgi:hypothetical protein